MTDPISTFGTIINPANNEMQGVRSPLESLETPNEGFGMLPLTYPNDIDKQSGHFVMFHIVETIPGAGLFASSAGEREFPKPFSAEQVNLTGIPGDDLQNIIARGRKRRDATNAALIKARASTAELTKASVTKLRSETLGTVVIYMPEKITAGYGFEYQGEQLRLAAAGAGAITAVKDVLGGATDLTPKQRSELLGALSREFSIKFATGLIDQLGALVGANVGARAFLERNIREVVNPHMQFLFRSVNQRTFEYTFNFVPHDRHESEVIDNIIRTFKFFSHPEYVGAGRFQGFPAEFDIQYISRELKPSGEHASGDQYNFQENDWLNRIGRCYLSNMSVDYSAAGVYATHTHHASPIPSPLGSDVTTSRSGNPPTHITMTLTFSELETLNRQHIREGF